MELFDMAVERTLEHLLASGEVFWLQKGVLYVVLMVNLQEQILKMSCISGKV